MGLASRAYRTLSSSQESDEKKDTVVVREEEVDDTDPSHLSGMSGSAMGSI